MGKFDSMTWHLWLDILLVLLIVLFAPIGYMRGPVKEVLVSFGVLLGVLLAVYWAGPWGADLDTYTELGDDASSFIVAMAFLVTVTLICGYGLGLTLASAGFRLQGRLLGATVSIFNGILMISFTLQYVRLYLLSDANEESLRDSYVVQFLLDEIGWILLVAAAAVLPVLGYVLITGRRAYDYETYEEYDEDYEYENEEYLDDVPEFVPVPVYGNPGSEAESRVLPPRVPAYAPIEDTTPEYKTDPIPDPQDLKDATRPVVASDRDEASQPTIVSSPESRSITGDTDPQMEVITPENEVIDTGSMHERGDRKISDDLPSGYRRCTHCRSVMSPGSHICPVCGEIN